jgi:N-methylhydantoinase B
MNAADLAVFDALFSSVAEEMGAALERAATSTNIKERRDLSCAVFDAEGNLVAQAAHIPVHLGAMPLSVRAALERRPPAEGDVVLLNDPWCGGTHLPDLTAVARAGRFLVANRAHHADVGGAWPGSFGPARDVHAEGLRIPPVRIVERGVLDRDLLDLFCANVRNPAERREDLVAQVETLRLGARRLAEIGERTGVDAMLLAAAALRSAARGAAEAVVRTLRPGVHRFEDAMDDGWPVRVAIEARDGRLSVDFAGTHAQVDAPLNANFAVTLSAVLYAFALLLPEGTPLNEGVRDVLDVDAPEGTLVNALYPSPVAGGNVETSQRIVDVVLGALDQALPGRLPAASQGTMNNLTFGWRGKTYYETIAGGSGGAPEGPGTSAIHTHLTNTRNTPIEALENAAPVIVRTLRVARGTGGEGRHRGGDGCLKEIEFLERASVNLLTERRRRAPYGLSGGAPGKCGRNEIVRGGEAVPLPGRAAFDVGPGDRLRIRTPGGGGSGAAV